MKSKIQQARPKEEEDDNNDPKLPTEFSSTLIRVAVSQICHSVGFTSIQGSALETLTGVAAIYLQTLSRSAASYANISSRTQSNLVDLIHALHDLSSAHGFVGASALHRNHTCQLKSSVLKDLRLFAKFSDEIPFAKPLPRKRFSRNSKKNLNVNGPGDAVPHIPRWLPALPHASTYKVGDKTYVGGDKWWESNLGLIEDCGGIMESKKKKKKKKKKSGSTEDDHILPVERRSRVIFKI